MRDIRYAARALRRSPAFAVVAVLTLALGIGAATAIYSVVDALLLHPLPFPNGDRLVYVRQFLPKGCDDCYEVPIGNYPDLRVAFRGTVDLVAARSWSPVLAGREQTEVIPAQMVSTDFFRVLGAKPELGRTFAPDDSFATRHEIVLSDLAWRTRFGGDPEVIGRALTLDGVLFTVVGVLRADDTFPPRTQVWAVLSIDEALERDARKGPWVDVFGRLRPGIPFAQAASEAMIVRSQLALAYPDAMRAWRLEVQPMRNWHEDVRPVLLVFIVAVGLVLLTACVNLAGLLLVRLTARVRELAVKAALGASAGRIAWQLVTETLLLSLAGALAGVGFALLSVRAIHQAVPEELASFEPGWPHMHVNAHALVFAIGLAVVTAVLIASGPAAHFSRPALGEQLKTGARDAGSTTRLGRLRRGLVIAELALSVILLSAAGLLARTVAKMVQSDVGIRSDHVLTMTLSRSVVPGDTSRPSPTFFDQLTQQLEAMPGVTQAGVVTALPLSHHSKGTEFAVDGQPPPRPEDRLQARLQYVTPDYFAVLKIPLIAGRGFGADDPADTARVAIVNRELVRRFLPKDEALGRTLVIDGTRYRITGVVGNVYHSGPAEEPGAEIYLLQRYRPERAVDLAIRTTTDPLVAAPSLLSAIRRKDPSVAINRVRPMADVVAEFMSPYRLTRNLMVGFALLALLLSAVGLYGVVSYATAQRTREFGVRLALGAEARDLRSLVLVEGSRLILLGIGVGIAGAVILTRLMRFLLYGVGASDPLTFCGVALTMSLVALGSAYLPARRATRVDPVHALRSE